MFFTLYLLICAFSSALYYRRVKSISIKEVGLILLAIFAVDTLIKTSMTCIINYSEINHFFDDQTMAIIVIAMVFVSWLAIEPLYVNYKAHEPEQEFPQVTMDK